MVQVDTVKELKEAIKARKSPLFPGNLKMKMVMSAAAAYFRLEAKFKRKPTREEVTREMMMADAGAAEVPGAAASPWPWIAAIAISAFFAAVAIVAICKGNNGTLRRHKDGSFTIEWHKQDAPAAQ